jgi:hypothetical protein
LKLFLSFKNLGGVEKLFRPAKKQWCSPPLSCIIEANKPRGQKISQSLRPQAVSLLPEKSEGIFDSMRRKFKLREKNLAGNSRLIDKAPFF